MTSPEMREASGEKGSKTSLKQEVNRWKTWVQDNPVIALSGAIVCGMALGWVVKRKA
ncbi:hypothetical protein [Thalassoglobus sp.]|uniref:hypothetical protein n=1 Tax=Thalassoglobus sp. TaxID=2795869 RepID=UPI003AA9BC71